MRSFYAYYFLQRLNVIKEDYTIPKILEIITGENIISDISNIEKELIIELKNFKINSPHNLNYYLKVVDLLLDFYWYTRDLISLQESLTIFEERISNVNLAEYSDVPVEQYFEYFKMLELGSNRLLKKNTIDDFEDIVRQLEWFDIYPQFAYRTSNIIAVIYANEGDDQEKLDKTKYWIEKSFKESEEVFHAILIYELIRFTNKTSDKSLIKSIEQKIEPFRHYLEDIDYFENQLLMETVFDLFLELDNLKLTFIQNETEKTDKLMLIYKKLEDFADINSGLRSSSFAYYYYLISNNFFKFSVNHSNAEKRQKFSDIALDAIDTAIRKSIEVRSNLFETICTSFKGKILSNRTSYREAIKCFNDASVYFKRKGFLQEYGDSLLSISQIHIAEDKYQDAYQNTMDVMITSSRRVREGGFDLELEAFTQLLEIFELEIQKPGISWLTAELFDFFKSIQEFITQIEENHKIVGKRNYQKFLEHYIRLAKYSRFNIKTYFIYQMESIRLLKIGSLLSHDHLSHRLTDSIWRNLHNELNPLYYLFSDWSEFEEGFKNVPNMVRDATLNQCITIAKGGLPEAAEHLEDFSYRNLRSYITNGEVRRLGNFMYLKETKFPKLEHGVRKMLFKLFEDENVIFESIFDIPRFMVKFVDKEFYITDMEVELNIKATTVRKYLKTLETIKMVNHSKDEHNQSIFVVNKDYILNF